MTNEETPYVESKSLMARFVRATRRMTPTQRDDVSLLALWVAATAVMVIIHNVWGII